MTKIFKNNETRKAENGKRWYYVSSWVGYLEPGSPLYVECNLAPEVSLNGQPITFEDERKAVVKVKKLLKRWGHAENTDTIGNALELLWEEKKISGKMYMTLWTKVNKAA